MDLVPLKRSSLTRAQFELADVPPEEEWLANITNLKTRRAYKGTREIRVILYAKADSFCATAMADELSVEDILAIEHDVIPLDGADVFQQGEIDSIGDRVALIENLGVFPRLPATFLQMANQGADGQRGMLQTQLDDRLSCLWAECPTEPFVPCDSGAPTRQNLLLAIRRASLRASAASSDAHSSPAPRPKPGPDQGCCLGLRTAQSN